MKTTEKQAAPEALQADVAVESAAAVSVAPTEGPSASADDVSHENGQREADTDKTATATSPEKTAKTAQLMSQPQSQPPKSAKKERSTPAKPAATMPSKAKVSCRSMDELHERRIVKEPTLFERALAKQEKAKALLSAQTSGETSSSMALSDTKKAPLRKTSEQTPGRPRIKSIATTVKPVSAVKTPLKPSALTPGRAVTPSSSGDTKTKRTVTYKPYTGPVPPFQGDSLFTPKKPRAVASKATTPSRTPRPLSAIKGRQKQNSASKKQGTNTPTPAKGKENAQPQETASADTKSDPPQKDSEVEKVKSSPRVAALRVPVKEISSKKVTESASKVRREKYLQDGQTKASIARQAARSGLETNNPA